LFVALPTLRAKIFITHLSLAMMESSLGVGVRAAIAEAAEMIEVRMKGICVQLAIM
jgi:hypothetical protein